MQHRAALGVLFQLLIHDSDNRIGRGRYQCGFHVHTDVLHFGEAGVWEIDAIRRDLLGQQDMQNLIEAALIVDGVAGCVNQSGVDVHECRNRIFVHDLAHDYGAFRRVDRIHGDDAHVR